MSDDESTLSIVDGEVRVFVNSGRNISLEIIGDDRVLVALSGDEARDIAEMLRIAAVEYELLREGARADREKAHRSRIEGR